MRVAVRLSPGRYRTSDQRREGDRRSWRSRFGWGPCLRVSRMAELSGLTSGRRGVGLHARRQLSANMGSQCWRFPTCSKSFLSRAGPSWSARRTTGLGGSTDPRRRPATPATSRHRLPTLAVVLHRLNGGPKTNTDDNLRGVPTRAGFDEPAASTPWALTYVTLFEHAATLGVRHDAGAQRGEVQVRRVCTPGQHVRVQEVRVRDSSLDALIVAT